MFLFDCSSEGCSEGFLVRCYVFVINYGRFFVKSGGCDKELGDLSKPGGCDGGAIVKNPVGETSSRPTIITRWVWQGIRLAVKTRWVRQLRVDLTTRNVAGGNSFGSDHGYSLLIAWRHQLMRWRYPLSYWFSGIVGWNSSPKSFSPNVLGVVWQMLVNSGEQCSWWCSSWSDFVIIRAGGRSWNRTFVRARVIVKKSRVKKLVRPRRGKKGWIVFIFWLCACISLVSVVSLALFEGGNAIWRGECWRHSTNDRLSAMIEGHLLWSKGIWSWLSPNMARSKL